MSGEPPAKRAKNDDFPTVVAFDNLVRICEEIKGIDAQASEKIVEIDSKYNKLRQPLYAQRTEAIREYDQETGMSFWPDTMVNHPRLFSYFTHKTEKVLSYLSEIEIMEEMDQTKGFTIKLLWEDNPYFEEKVMEKRTLWDKERNKLRNYPVTITWKPGMNILKRKDKNVSPEIEDEGEYDDYFFGWLTTYTEEENDEIAGILRDEIWSNPVNYFVFDLKKTLKQNYSQHDLSPNSESDYELDESEVGEELTAKNLELNDRPNRDTLPKLTDNNGESEKPAKKAKKF
ncbi:Oidioi.mRNA.OKI2018_I69.XSR.g15176.t1.cds [Oikopleura dioica]|uniref:Oidioi.mRNA.OKI2018_I69.XSR.g15176.t1.cds n=1 Tax=Oikopleura dioica TaxID=34765 RepID=A0ABN7SH22_OIKDI|nr:Oidioi.mRNA.OKI2018_I69.XSR.g15176.t1.cds [Oikopleura dioica]